MIVGVDGCKGGWIAVSQASEHHAFDVQVHANFATLVGAYPTSATICVDMPIGLPTLGMSGGRAAEHAVRPFLKKRKSSVFAIPSRAAVYAAIPPFEKGAYGQAHAKACAIARQTSQPAAGFPIQAFGIFPKIRDIDQLLRCDAHLGARIFESHPEFAFAKLNADIEMQHSKVTPLGEQMRRAVLVAHGFTNEFVQQTRFHHAKTDDFLDACVMMIIANRIRTGKARPFPNPPAKDDFGIDIAIWA